jgi:hypothetical protein
VAESPLVAVGTALAVPVLDIRVAGKRDPVIPMVTVLDAVRVGGVLRAEHVAIPADRPTLRRNPFPQLVFAVEMDDVLIPRVQPAHRAGNGEAPMDPDLPMTGDRCRGRTDRCRSGQRSIPESSAIVCRTISAAIASPTAR